MQIPAAHLFVSLFALFSMKEEQELGCYKSMLGTLPLYIYLEGRTHISNCRRKELSNKDFSSLGIYGTHGENLCKGE